MNIARTASFLLIVILLNMNIVFAKESVVTEYLIGPEDVIEVTVWKNEELSKLVVVRPDGKITLPLIDDIYADGVTSSQLKEEITLKLKEFIDDPHVTITVAEINSSKIYVLGEVVNPGVYLLRSEISVLQAITLAGGFRKFAATNKMFVLRKNKKTERINVSYKDIIRGKSEQNVSLKRGDIVVVP